MFLPGHSQNCEGYLQTHWPLRAVKVLPKVEPFSLAFMEEGVNVGPRDKVLHLYLDSHVVRMSFFRSIKSAFSGMSKSSNESRHRTSWHTP